MSEQERLFKRLNERFVKAFVTYDLLRDGDHILVGLSGGKDSLLLTELLAKRARTAHPAIRVEAVHVRMENIAYKTSTAYLEQFCNDLDVPLHIVTTSFETSASKQKPACFLCSWYRRKELFNLAQELGCNKIALGHHQDDLIHTALMNLTFQSRFDTMPARLKMKKMPLHIIRPLCLIQEEDVRRYAELSGYVKQEKLCPFETASNRAGVKTLFAEMERLNPEARYSIWSALNKAGKLVEDE